MPPNTPPAGSFWTNAFAGGIINPNRITNFAGRNVREHVRNHPYSCIENWTFRLDREVTSNLMLEAPYVGSKTTHLYWNRQDNQNSPDLLPLGAALLQPAQNPFFGKINQAHPGLHHSAPAAAAPVSPFPGLLIFRDSNEDMSYQRMTLRAAK